MIIRLYDYTDIDILYRYSRPNEICYLYLSKKKRERERKPIS